MNTAKTFALMIGLMILFMSLGYWLGGQTGIIWAFVIATAMNFFAYWKSDKMVLAMYRAREIDESATGRPGRLYALVKEMATMNSMPMPRVYIIPNKAPNAFATGRNKEHAAVAATEGLLETLSDHEVKAVMGHEWGAIFGGYSRDGDRGGGIGLLVTALLAPIMAVVIQTAISRQREYKADDIGGRIAGQGGHMALAAALQKIHRAPVRMNLDDRPGTANLMIANPLSGRGLTNLFSTHPPMEKRVERLHKLAQEAVYQGYARS